MELVVASGLGAVLLGGMASSVYVASLGLDVAQNNSHGKSYAARALDQIVSDVRHALVFSERTTIAIAFTVPDRDSDGNPETIRYAWSGVAGDPLTYELNGQSGGNLVDSVDNLDFSYVVRIIDARSLD